MSAAERLARPFQITPRECLAIRLLHADGRSVRELAFLLECKEETISRHTRGECGHAATVPEGLA